MERALLASSARPPRRLLDILLGAAVIRGEDRVWLRDAAAERAVGRLLDDLPAGWTVRHAVPIGDDDTSVDHLVIGPGGVFAVDTRACLGARAWVGRAALLVDGVEKDWLRQVDLEASRVGHRLARVLPAGVPVVPVLVFAGLDDLSVKARPRTVQVLETRALVRFLARRDAVLDAAQCLDLVRHVDDPAAWRPTEAVDGTVPSRFAAVERADRRARLVRVGWGAALLGGLVAALGDGAAILLSI